MIDPEAYLLLFFLGIKHVRLNHQILGLYIMPIELLMALEQVVNASNKQEVINNCIIRDDNKMKRVVDGKIPGFIIAGQSNAQGTDTAAPSLVPHEYDVVSSKIFQWPSAVRGNGNPRGDTAVKAASNPLLHPRISPSSDKVVGPGLAFAHELLKARNVDGFLMFQEVHLIPSAVGEQSIASGGSLAQGGRYYDSMIETAQNFLSSNSNHCLAGILFHQGETDIGAPASDPDSYKRKLTKWVGDVRGDLNIPNLPIITGTHVIDWVNTGRIDLVNAEVDEDVTSIGQVNYYRNSKLRILSITKDSYNIADNMYAANLIDLPPINSSSTASINEIIHFNVDSSRQHGIRAAHAFLNLVTPSTDDHAPLTAPANYNVEMSDGVIKRIVWSQADGGAFSTYDLKVFDVTAGNNLVISETNVEGLSFTPSTTLRANRLYDIQVSAVNDLGRKDGERVRYYVADRMYVRGAPKTLDLSTLSGGSRQEIVLGGRIENDTFLEILAGDNSLVLNTEIGGVARASSAGVALTTTRNVEIRKPLSSDGNVNITAKNILVNALLSSLRQINFFAPEGETNIESLGVFDEVYANILFKSFNPIARVTITPLISSVGESLPGLSLDTVVLPADEITLFGEIKTTNGNIRLDADVIKGAGTVRTGDGICTKQGAVVDDSITLVGTTSVCSDD